jgi:peptidoglycan/LPS O-acetylase OafA/YrhL
VDEAVELQARSGRPRLFALDALRGLAAVSVVVHHFHEAFSAGNVRWWSVLFGSGKAAVVLFFVLSGYVLSLPSWEGRQGPYGIYLVRRVCRIYLPFAAAAALSIAGDAVFWRFHPALSGWYALTWHAPVSPALVLVQFTMWPMAVFNTAFWSLFFEMEMSVAMPWVCAALKRVNGVAATLGSYGVVYAATWVLAHRHVDVVGHPAGWNALRTVQILCHFLLGATLARYSGRIGELWRAMAAWQWLALAGSLGCYWNLAVVFPVRGIAGVLRHVPAEADLAAALGAVGIILCSLHLRPLGRVLESAVPEYLGRVSYSLYLMHSIVLFAVLDLLYGRLPKLALFGMVMVGSLVLGHLFCVAVEEPAMRLGKRLAKRLAGRGPVRALGKRPASAVAFP